MLHEKFHHLKRVLSKNQYKMLIALAYLADWACTLKKLSEISGIPKSTLWDYLAMLIDQEIITTSDTERRPKYYLYTNTASSHLVIDILRSLWLHPQIPHELYGIHANELLRGW